MANCHERRCFLIHRMIEPSGFYHMFDALLPIAIDVFDDEFDDDDDGNGEEHACSIEDFAAQNDAKDDGNGMEMQGFSDERRIDEIMVDLCEYDIESQGLQCHDGRLRCRKDCAETRCNRRPQDGNEFTDARNHSKDRGIGEIPDREIGKYYDARDATDDQLAEHIDTQRSEDAVKQIEHTRVVLFRKQSRQIAFDGFSVRKKIKCHKEDDDDIDEFVEQREQQGQGRLQGSYARIHEL